MLSSKILKGTKRVRTGRSKRPILQPYEVRIDGSRRGAFEDVRDAISSAHIARQERPAALISVAYRPTGNLVVEITP
jgi:hypothetical protein